MSGRTPDMNEQRSIQRIYGFDVELPPAKPGIRYVRVPRVGRLLADDELRKHVHGRFRKPMIILALLFLPLLAIEFFWRPEQYTWLWWVMAVGLAIVWLAFFIEFVIKIAIAECRIEYCKRNWLDIVIILVPVLRTMRIAQVARTARVFTLRGVGMKALRYVIAILIGLEFAEKILERLGMGARAGRKDPRDMTRYQLIDEVKKLRALTDAWQDWHEAHEQWSHETGIDLFNLAAPQIELAEEELAEVDESSLLIEDDHDQPQIPVDEHDAGGLVTNSSEQRDTVRTKSTPPMSDATA